MSRGQDSFTYNSVHNSNKSRTHHHSGYGSDSYHRYSNDHHREKHRSHYQDLYDDRPRKRLFFRIIKAIRKMEDTKMTDMPMTTNTIVTRVLRKTMPKIQNQIETMDGKLQSLI